VGIASALRRLDAVVIDQLVDRRIYRRLGPIGELAIPLVARPALSTGIDIVRYRDGWAEKARDYRIMLDGVEVGRLPPGGSVAIPATPGFHELWLKLDWTGSSLVRFSLGQNERIRLRCQSAGDRRPSNVWNQAPRIQRRAPWIAIFPDEDGYEQA
jgi:hypothetical protein